jgi:hypothetical protein
MVEHIEESKERFSRSEQCFRCMLVRAPTTHSQPGGQKRMLNSSRRYCIHMSLLDAPFSAGKLHLSRNKKRPPCAYATSLLHPNHRPSTN